MPTAPTPQALARDWAALPRTRDAGVHLTRTSDPDHLTSTSVLLARTPIVEGGQIAARDTLLVVSTIHRDGAYESFAGVVVRKQFASRTVLIHPVSLSALTRHETEFAAEILTGVHEDALATLARRLRTDFDYATHLGFNLSGEEPTITS